MSPALQLRLMTLVAFCIFGSIALFYPRVLPLMKRRRMKPPHPAIAMAFRLWFAVLAAASLALLIFPTHPHP